MTWLVAVLAGLAVVVLLGPRPRVGRVDVGSAGRSGGGGVRGRSDAGVERLVMAWRSFVSRGRSRGPELGIICTSVASRVRGGEDPRRAWAVELGDGTAGAEEDDGRDDVRGAVATGAGDLEIPPALARLRGTSPGADAAIVATRVAHRCGTPLADVLEQVAVGIADAEAAELERRRARAAPAATARILGWLPLASLLLGAGMGADPIGRLLEGGLPTLSMVVGGALTVLGRWWIRSMVKAAGRDAPDGDRPGWRAPWRSSGRS